MKTQLLFIWDDVCKNIFQVYEELKNPVYMG